MLLESLPAVFTNKWSVLAVDIVFMVLQMTLQFECLVTLDAGEGTAVGVSAYLVLLQVASQGECLPADSAGVLPRTVASGMLCGFVHGSRLGCTLC